MIDRQRALPIWPTSSFPTAGTTARSRSNSRPAGARRVQRLVGPAIRAGETFDRVTEKALEEARAVVVLWSRRSVESDWVRAEATQARATRRLVPVMIERCRRPVIFELSTRRTWRAGAAMPPDPRWRTFIDDLRRTTGEARQDPRSRSSVRLRRPQVAKARAVELPSGSGPRCSRPQAWRIGLCFRETERRAHGGNSLHTAVSVAQNGVTLAVLPFANLSADPAQDYSPTALPRRSSIGWRGFRRCG